ncbi:hypothetical protein [Paenibacillus sp. N3.4]|uniref:hypothetical protein n=1 Tax=Paenibacillus sp. N3.4 TaxID=2603222 RepID=UPI0011CC9886|nr:hypothetical protein [Paenibacillus sp. N3.4]TXK81837.1 hypothetical protein FU659_15760 [Paenibacillus sp. N3.4]
MKKTILVMFLTIAIVLLMTSCGADKEIDDPEKALKMYLQAISDQDAGMLVKIFGGEYTFLEQFSPVKQRDNKKKIFGNYLKVIPTHIYLNEIMECTKIDDNHFMYKVNFRNSDGTLFDVGDTQRRSDTFFYSVEKREGTYKVLEPPPYQS